MSRHRQNRSPFWQDNVLHVPTSPFMSPTQSPAASPIHSPLARPRSRRNRSPGVDIASAILTSINASNPVMSIDDLLANFAAHRGVFVADDEEEEEEEEEEENEGQGENNSDAAGTANSPIDLDEEGGGQYYLDRSVQRAYEDFLRQVQQQNRPTSPLTPPPPPPPPPPSRRSMLIPLRMPPPPPSAPLSQRRPTNLRVLTNRRSTVAVRIPTGGYTFVRTSPRGTLLVSPRRTRRRSTQTLSASHRPLIRQVVTVSEVDMQRRMARNRARRYARQLAQSQAPVQSMSAAAGSVASARVIGFDLTESFGLPEDKCAICLELYKIGDTVSYVACQPHNGGKDHLFHTHCINQWVDSLFRSGNYTRSCPVCRGEF